MRSRPERVWSLNSLAIAIPVLAIVATHFSFKSRPAPSKREVETKPLEVEPLMDPALIRHATATKNHILQDLIEDSITIEDSIESFHHHLTQNAKLTEGLSVLFGQRPSEELAAINLMLFLQSRQDNPQAEEKLRQLMNVFERLHGPQVWVLTPYGVRPNPID